MKHLLKYIYRSVLLLILFSGPFYFFQGCSSYEDNMIGSFPYLELGTQDTTISNLAQEVKIDIKTNREWSFNTEFPDGNDNWLNVQKEADQLVLSITANPLEKIVRICKINIQSSSGNLNATLTVYQDPSSELTYAGDAILRTPSEIDEFKDYTKVSGWLFIGDPEMGNRSAQGTAALAESTSSSVSVEIDGTFYPIRPSQINSLKGISGIHHIGKKALYIVNTQVATLPGSVSGIELEKLVADYNRLSDLDSIIPIQTLKELSIRGNAIADASALSQLPQLTKLNIASNSISDISFLGNLTNLSTLILGNAEAPEAENNNITDITILNKLSNLEQLTVSGLPLSALQIEVLRAQHPNCIILAENLKESPVPAVRTYEPEKVNEESVRLNGTIENPKGTISKAGFLMGTSVIPQEMTDYPLASLVSGSFSLDVPVQANTRYYIMAYAVNEKGIGYGEIRTWGDKNTNGDVILESQQELNQWVTEGITRINGRLILGKQNSSAEGLPVLIGEETRYFTASDIQDISALSTLSEVSEGIWIVNGKIGSATPLTRIQSTPSLCLKGNKIETLPDFSEIQALRSLDVSMNRISDISVLAKMNQLTELKLGDRLTAAHETNNITRLDDLYGLRNLRKLDLSGLPLNLNAVEALRSMLTQCEIYAEELKIPAIPSVSSHPASEITAYTAVLNGVIDNMGSGTISEYGFYWGSDPENLQKIVAGTDPMEGWYSAVVDLEIGKTYYFRAYATNENGEGTGVTLSFRAGNTQNGTLFLTSQTDIDNFLSQGIRQVEGSVYIGQGTTTPIENVPQMYIDGSTYYFPPSDIQDLSQLAFLEEVTGTVYLINNPALRDIKPLTTSAKINNLTLIATALDDFSTLSGLQLNMLTITDVNLPDLGFLSGMTGIYNLYIRQTGISDLSPLSGLTQLITLDLSNNRISDLTPLSGLSRLSSLYLSQNRIEDISPLASLRSLETLYLGNPYEETNTIHDIDILKDFSSLRYLYLGGLPLSQTQVDAIRAALPACTIYAENLKNYAPVLQLSSVEAGTNSIYVKAEVSSEGISALTGKGFYYGTTGELSSMIQVPVSGNLISENGRLYFATTLEGLNQSEQYYIIGYAANSHATAYTPPFAVETEGPAQITTGTVSEISETGAMFHGTVIRNGGTLKSYGFVWGATPDITLEHNEGKESVEANIESGKSVQVSTDKLKAGLIYYVRFYVVNDFGTYYGESVSFTTAGSPDLTQFDFTVIPQVPEFIYPNGTSAGGNELNSPLYAYYFYDNVTGSGKALGSSSDQAYIYPLYQGTQDLIFTNLNTENGKYTLTSSRENEEYLNVTLNDGTNGAGSDVLIGLLNVQNISGNTQQEVTLQHEVARFNVTAKALDAEGQPIGNLSEKLSHIKLEIHNFYAGFTVFPDLTLQNKGQITLRLESDITSTESSQLIAEKRYTFPTVNGTANTVTAELTLSNGKTIKINAALTTKIEKGKAYTIELVFSENPLQSGFILKDINIVNEEIELN